MHRSIFKHGIAFCILVSCASLATAQDQSEIDPLLKIIETTKNDSVKISTLNTLSQQLYNVDLKQSLQFSREALMLSEQQPNNKGKLDAQNMLMRIHRRLGNFEIAIRYALDGAALAIRLKDSLQLFESYSALGNIHSSILNYVEADQYLRKAYTVGVKSHKPGISATLNFIGRNLGRWEIMTAQNYTSFVQKKLEEANPQPGYTLSYIYNNLAEAYLGKGENKLALYYYQKSEALDQSKKSPFGMTFTLNGLALVYKQMGEYAMAKDAIKKSLRISSKYFYRDKAKESYTILYEIYESQKDFENAFEAYKLSTFTKTVFSVMKNSDN
ncbi:MAG: hypothetical protein IPJ20_11695 [Flammeovirgaceae bacterium]|nr:hypothetical protein [Flammeovirgaceae bacterium]